MSFKLLKTEGAARRGEFTTVHGVIQTPVFMNVGTSAAIKGGVSTLDLKNIKCQVELSNTYHLHVRPGEDVIYKLGGIHKFFNWQKPVLTDSGGFQVFSLAKLRNITGEGGTADVTTVSDMLVFRTEDGIEILDYAGNITILHEYDGFRSERRVGRALFCVLKDRGGNLRRVAAVDGVIDMDYDFDGNDKKYRAELYDAANAFARAVIGDDADGVKKYGTAELAEAFLKYRDGDDEGNPQGKHIFDFRKFYEGFDGALSCRNSELTGVVPVFADEEDGYFALAFDIPHTSPSLTSESHE